MLVHFGGDRRFCGLLGRLSPIFRADSTGYAASELFVLVTEVFQIGGQVFDTSLQVTQSLAWRVFPVGKPRKKAHL
jgi:hypothetical protein